MKTLECLIVNINCETKIERALDFLKVFLVNSFKIKFVIIIGYYRASNVEFGGIGLKFAAWTPKVGVECIVYIQTCNDSSPLGS